MLNRRNFIKNAILGGTALASINALADDISASVRKGKNRTQKFNMHGYAAPRIVGPALTTVHAALDQIAVVENLANDAEKSACRDDRIALADAGEHLVMRLLLLLLVTFLNLYLLH